MLTVFENNSLTPAVNMKTAIAVIIFNLYIIGRLMAQSSTIISGFTQNENGGKVAYVNISLNKSVDSSFYKGIVTSEEGFFKIDNVIQGSYYIKASSVGYKVTYSDEINLSGENEKSIILKLIPDENKLEEVVVKGQRPYIEVKADRTIINVAGNIRASGTNLLDILRKSPNIRMVSEDDITINGKNGVSVYLDGNRININGRDINELLKSIQSSNIQTIEIITNPSSKYDAAGNAGVISITTKRNEQSGFNGNVTLNGATSQYYPKSDIGLGLNYRSSKVGFNGNYNYANSITINKTEFFRKQTTNDGILTNFNQIFSNKSKNIGHNFKFGIDVDISHNSKVQFTLDGNMANRVGTSSSRTVISKSANTIDSILIANNDQDRYNRLLNYNLNYRYSDTMSRELVININHLNFSLEGNSFQPNNYFDVNNMFLSSIIYSYQSVTGIKVYSLKADYSQKLVGGKLALGTKYVKTHSDNNFTFYNVVDNKYYLDYGKTNQFLYNEEVFAGYLNYNRSWRKWDLQLGIRGEHTSTSGVLNDLTNAGTGTAAVINNYINFFPNAEISSKWNDNHTTTIIYNSRIDRPAYQDLNPFIYIQDKYSFLQGNPFLLPQRTYIYKISHDYKQIINVNASYSDTQNFIVRYRDSTIDGRTYQTNINIAHQKNFSLEAYTQISLRKWWSSDYTLSVSHQEVKGTANKIPINMSQNTWSISGNNTFTAGRNWSAELSWYYNSKFLDVPAIVNSQWTMDIGIQKKIFKQAGNFRFAISDIFNTLQLSLVRDFGGLYYTNRIKWETRQFRLSFNYRFGHLKLKPTPNRESSIGDEKKRLR